MGSKTLRRILKSGFKAGSGVLGAQIQAAKDEEERRRQSNQDTLASLLGYARVDQAKAATEASQARTEAIQNPGIDTKDIITSAAQQAMENGDWATYNLLTGKGGGSGNWKPLGKTPYLYNEKSGETKQLDPAVATAIGVANTKQPETGIGDFKDVVLNRQKQADEARNAALWQIFNSFPELFFDKDKTTESGYAESPREEFINYTPEQLVEYVKQQEPETIKERTKFNFFSPNEYKDVSNPEYEKLTQTLSGIDIPPGYQIPVGDEARGLQDSVNIGQRDAGMAGALMRTNMGIPPAQQGQDEDPILDTVEQVEEYVRQNPDKAWLLRSPDYLEMKRLQ